MSARDELTAEFAHIPDGGCMASATDSSHLCSTDCAPIYCPFSGDGNCTAGLDYCPSMHQRMCINGEEERDV